MSVPVVPATPFQRKILMTSRKTYMLFVALFAALLFCTTPAFAAPITVTAYCENCDKNVTVWGSVTVEVTPPAQTVKRRTGGALPENTAEYTVLAKHEKKVLDPSGCTCAITFEAQEFLSFTQPPVANPADANLSITPSALDPLPQGWEIGQKVAVCSTELVESRISFTVRAKYKLKNGENSYLADEETKADKVVTFSSTVSCTFKAVEEDYALTIWAGDPPFSPDPPKGCSNTSSRCTTGNCKSHVGLAFNISFVKFEDDVIKDVDSTEIKKVEYRLAVEGDKTQIIAFRGLSGNRLDSPAVNTPSPPVTLLTSVPAVLCARAPGDKTATLTVTVTLVDDTVWEDSETISLTVPDFYFAVFIRAATNDKDGASYEMQGRGCTRFIDVGHAAWKVGVSPQEFPKINGNLTNFANQPWGSGPVAPIPNFLPQPPNWQGPQSFWADPLIYPLDAAMIHFALMNPKTPQSPDDNPTLNVGVLGRLSSDGAGGEIRRYTLEKRSDAEKALQHIQNSFPGSFSYKVPDNNCVDQCIAAMANAGVLPEGFDIEKVKGERKIFFEYSTGQRKHWIINLSIPAKFQAELTRLATQP